MTATPEIADTYARADRPLSALLESLSADDWDAPSPCEGWVARDVVAHLVDAQRSFLADRGLDLGPGPDLGADPAAGWRTHADQVAALVADPAVAEVPFEGHFGPTTVGETLAAFYVFDMVAHRWDIAHAANRNERFSDAELDVMEAAIPGWGPALYMDGVCRSGVEAPTDADRQTRLLATLGRRA